jgi:hypothetical protein
LALEQSWGSLQLGWLIFNGYNTSQNPYVNIKMEKKLFKSMLGGDNVVIDELKKLIQIRAQLDNSLP